MRDKKFPISNFSPTIQEMCRLRYHFRSYGDATEPIDYITRFSLTNDDIPDLLEIAAWLGKEMVIGTSESDCWDAPRHAWEALALFDPIQVVPQMLDFLNRLNWEYADSDFLQNVLGNLGKRSAKEAQETKNAALNTIPLFLVALKERERHSKAHSVLSLAVGYMTHGFPEYHTEFHRFLQDDLAELRIGCREWYVEAVCDLAFVENPTSELVALLNKACREGYVETWYWKNDGLKETFGFDFDNDPELLAIYEKSEAAHKILDGFRNCGRTFPHQAVQKARELRDWIIPNLIEVVRDATAYARFHVPNGDGTIQFAVHLLAEFQAKEALPAIFDSLSLSSDDLWDYMYGDGLYEAMPGILNRLIGDDLEFYDQKLRDPQVPEALQHCLSQSLRYLVARKIISIETYGSWLRDYLEIAIQAEKKELVTALVCDICVTANPDYIPLVRSAFEKNLVTENMIWLKDAERDLKTPNPSRMITFPDPKEDFSDTVKELSSWAWFQEKSYRPTQPKPASPPVVDVSQGSFDDILYLSSKKPYQVAEFNERTAEHLKATRKVGRNDPCPCGSGKKHKKCCLK